MLEFVCWIAVLAPAAAFLLALAQKWGWLEWLQVHAPNDFLYKLFSCHFCSTWWVCVVLALGALAVTGNWTLLIAPPCATMIALRLW